jgi:2-polyprenyl-3-methyl-5-hydroxy-6-metoxy-1,4-benzoquinol methylase
MEKACKICGNTENNTLYKVREMFMGLREKFTYQLCGSCGCMQLINVPDELGEYYPADKYYSFNTANVKKVSGETLRKIKAEYLLFNKHRILGRALSIGYNIPEYFSWLKNANVNFDDAILDVGCGDGGLLVGLAKIGFTNLTGIDPYNEQDNIDYGGVKIYKKTIFELDGSFNFIMLNHVFEHLDNPKETLERLYQMLKPDSYLLIRTPVMGTYAWKKYQENWMQLDAPRHLIIHSIKSMNIVAEQTGFVIQKTVFDSTANSLIGSEQYIRDIPLTDKNSYLVNKASTIFTKSEIQNFKEVNKLNNESGNGDQAAFYLYKP